MTDRKIHGRCLCGDIRYTITGDLRDAHICHCSQCRRQSGHAIAAASALRTSVAIDGAENLSWFSASDAARRGFCRTCGSMLFWDDGGTELSINLGALDAPTGARVTSHIFVADKGDYYDINDGLPQHDAYPADRAGGSDPA